MKNIIMTKSICGSNGWHEDGTQEFIRVSRWITVKTNYNPSPKNSLWDYAEDGYGYKPSSDKFNPDEHGGAYLTYFTYGGRNYATEQFLALGNPFDENEIDGGIYENVTIDDVRNDIQENQGAAPRVPTIEELDEQIICFIPLIVSGKTYQERKADIKEKAIEWSNNLGQYPRWSYGELAIISDFFEKFGRRYGLLKEFRENAIC